MFFHKFGAFFGVFWMIFGYLYQRIFFFSFLTSKNTVIIFSNSFSGWCRLVSLI